MEASAVGEVVAEIGERRLSSVRQHHADVRGVDRAELVAKAAHGELADLAGELDPGRSGTHDHDGREEPPGLVGRGGLGHLEGAVDAPAQLERVVDRLHPRCDQRELVVSEVGLAGTRSDDQAVVREVDLETRDALGVHDPLVEIETGDLDELRPHVLVLAEQVTEDGCDLTGREDAGRHLVEERLEEMVVAAVEQRHLGSCAREQTDRRQPAEATPHDHHPVSGGTGCRHGDLRSPIAGPASIRQGRSY